MKIFKSCGIVFLFIASSVLFACGGGGSGAGDLGGVGTVSMSLTDAMSNQFNAMYVTINDVQVHTKGSGNGNNGWVTVSTPNLPKTFNLYELTNGVREQIGLADLSAGDYTQMRMMIGTEPDDGINILSEAHPYANYVIDSDGMYQELKIPSGIQSGYKIIHGFTISPNQTTELTLDFLAEKSVVVGGTGNWHIQPTVKIRNTPELEQSIIRGWVTSNGTNGISGALVSVQRYNGSADDPKDEVTIQASTITDEDGYFSIFVSPLSSVDDEYNLVVYGEGKTPEYRKITGTELASGDTLTFFDDPINFPNARGFIQLSDAIINNVHGLVTITDDSIEQYASVSFRQDIGVSPDIEMIEVTSLNIAHESSYSINLPNGSYSVVASTLDYDTIENPLTVLETLSSIDFPITFP
jgi:hypothetical protein